MINNFTFWLVIALIFAFILLSLFFSLKRNSAASLTRKDASDALQNAQLHELERARKLGQIDETEADAMRIEINRAHSRATRRGEDGELTQGSPAIMWGVVVGTLCLSLLVYSWIGIPGLEDFGAKKRAELKRPSQERVLELLSQNNALPAAPVIDAQTQDLLEKLEAAIAANPNIAEGYMHLNKLHFSTGNYEQAYKAQEKYIELIGSAATSEDFSNLAENMVLAASGYVSPQAEAAVRRSLQINPENNVALFYMGVTLKQEKQFEQAAKVFAALDARNLGNPAWTEEVKRQLAEVNSELNLQKGPSSEQIADAANMSEDARMEMIGGMVEGLKSRLANEGGSPQEWARLISSLRVLGREDEAKAILGEALSKFPDAAEIQALK